MTKTLLIASALLLVGCSTAKEVVVIKEPVRIMFEDCYRSGEPDVECLNAWQDQYDECYLDGDDGKTYCCISDTCFLSI